ncbi:DUF1127 domain-containing protein [Xanthobacter sp. V3C-3]|uniref:DUF1127 domain-containing protein n=1 Tax=Xanthobacter lutulentifluminis TaxID=3119935 RepID=UPI00372C6992
MTIHGETRRIVYAPAGEMAAALCLGLVALARKAVHATGSIGRALERRQVMAELAGLDDHMLRDIGITRADLRDASITRLHEDPTRVLVLRATERRAAVTLGMRDRRS